MTQQPKRRRSRGAAWYWQQTDSWYFTRPGTKQRVPLSNESGKRIRGQGSKKDAELALARVKVARQWRPTPEPTDDEQWLVAKVCSKFIQDVKQRAANGSVVEEYRDEVIRYLILLSEYCGALPVSQLQKGHIQHWVESHDSWRSPVTRRNAITIVQAAFNHAAEEHGVRNPLKGLKKPPARPRLHSLDDEDEAAIYSATDEPYANFLFAAVRTGLRPFCELAKLTAGDIEEPPHGMMWRVYASKTKKTRKIPVRTDVADLTRSLIGDRPDRDLVVFRNPQSNPWKKVTGAARFLKIKRALDWESDPVRSKYSTYSCRHTFAHTSMGSVVSIDQQNHDQRDEYPILVSCWSTPIFSSLLLTAGIAFSSARADGYSSVDAAAIAALEVANPLPVGYEEGKAVGEAVDATFEGAHLIGSGHASLKQRASDVKLIRDLSKKNETIRCIFSTASVPFPCGVRIAGYECC